MTATALPKSGGDHPGMVQGTPKSRDFHFPKCGFALRLRPGFLPADGMTSARGQQPQACSRERL